MTRFLSVLVQLVNGPAGGSLVIVMEDPHIVVAGAGNIGCYVGGLLAAGGRRVTLLARRQVIDGLGEGLRLTSLDGLDLQVERTSFAASDDAAVLATAELILVTVKSGATAEMAQLIARHAPPDALVISLQNGIGNADTLRQASGRQVLAGMVPFNVIQLGHGRYHRGTSGKLVIEQGAPATLRALRVPHLGVEAAADMAPVLWGKLLLNLNNALNALSGLTLYEQLQQRSWRRILAAQQAEALALLETAGVKPWSLGPLPARLLPHMLRLPTPLFRLLARSAVRIDRQARSSMSDDLGRGRRTEIDELQGAVVALGRRLGRSAPVNERVLALVREGERTGSGSPRLTPDQILAHSSKSQSER